MEQFKVGDRVRYVGNKGGDTFNYRMALAKPVGTVTEVYPYEQARVVWDDEAWKKTDMPRFINLELVTDEPVSLGRAGVVKKYAAEFDDMVSKGTIVQKYTALGFLTSFLNEIDDLKE